MTTTHISVPASEIDKLNSQVLAITKLPVEEAGYPAGLRKATERFLANIDARNLAIGSNLIQQHAKDFLDVLEKIVQPHQKATVTELKKLLKQKEFDNNNFLKLLGPLNRSPYEVASSITSILEALLLKRSLLGDDQWYKTLERHIVGMQTHISHKIGNNLFLPLILISAVASTPELVDLVVAASKNGLIEAKARNEHAGNLLNFLIKIQKSNGERVPSNLVENFKKNKLEALFVQLENLHNNSDFCRSIIGVIKCLLDKNIAHDTLKEKISTELADLRNKILAITFKDIARNGFRVVKTNGEIINLSFITTKLENFETEFRSQLKSVCSITDEQIDYILFTCNQSLSTSFGTYGPAPNLTQNEINFKQNNSTEPQKQYACSIPAEPTNFKLILDSQGQAKTLAYGFSIVRYNLDNIEEKNIIGKSELNVDLTSLNKLKPDLDISFPGYLSSIKTDFEQTIVDEAIHLNLPASVKASRLVEANYDESTLSTEWLTACKALRKKDYKEASESTTFDVRRTSEVSFNRELLSPEEKIKITNDVSEFEKFLKDKKIDANVYKFFLQNAEQDGFLMAPIISVMKNHEQTNGGTYVLNGRDKRLQMFVNTNEDGSIDLRYIIEMNSISDTAHTQTSGKNLGEFSIIKDASGKPLIRTDATYHIKPNPEKPGGVDFTIKSLDVALNQLIIDKPVEENLVAEEPAKNSGQTLKRVVVPLALTLLFIGAAAAAYFVLPAAFVGLVILFAAAAVITGVSTIAEAVTTPEQAKVKAVVEVDDVKAEMAAPVAVPVPVETANNNELVSASASSDVITQLLDEDKKAKEKSSLIAMLNLLLGLKEEVIDEDDESSVLFGRLAAKLSQIEDAAILVAAFNEIKNNEDMRWFFVYQIKKAKSLRPEVFEGFKIKLLVEKNNAKYFAEKDEKQLDSESTPIYRVPTAKKEINSARENKVEHTGITSTGNFSNSTRLGANNKK